MATQVTGQDRLLLLDGHSLAYRAFFALPIENFSTTTGQPTNAVYGFTAMLINVLRDEKPTHLAVAFDRGEPTFRHEQYVEYKANRRETPDDFRSQLSLIFEVLDALGIRRLSAPGYEADDLIATLATQAAAEDMDVLIVTGDRDVLQLVSDRVTVADDPARHQRHDPVHPGDRGREVRADPGAVPRLRRAARRPERQPARHPRRGGEDRDQVDRGVRLAGRPWSTGSTRSRARPATRCASTSASVLRNRQLTALVRDLPAETVGAVPGDLLPVAWDRDKIHQLFDTLAVPGAARPPLPDAPARPDRRDRDPAARGRRAAAAGEGASRSVTDLLGPGRGEPPGWPRTNRPNGPGSRCAGTWGRGTGNVTAHGHRRPGRHGAYLDPAQLTEADERALAAWLADPGQPEGPARRQGPDARARRPRPAAGRAGLRHRAGRLPGAARPAHLRPGRPGAALPGQGAARGQADRRPADAGRLGRARRGGRPGAAGPGHARAGRGAGRGPGPARVGWRCCTSSSCR